MPFCAAFGSGNRTRVFLPVPPRVPAVPFPMKYPCARVAAPTAAAIPQNGEATRAGRLLRGAGHIALAALIRTTVLTVLLVLFYAGHKSQPFQLDAPRTAPAPHSSRPAPALMERRAPTSP
jgi:hypothetical protein